MSRHDDTHDSAVAWVIAAIVILSLAIGSIALFLHAPPSNAPALGTALPDQSGLIDTYLAAGISSTATSMTLANGTTRDGASLSGYYCFTVDGNSPSVEFMCGTAAGTAVTGITRGIKPSDPTATSIALMQQHRRLASVQVTNFPFNQLAQRLLNGTDGFAAPLKYATEPSFSSRTQLIDKGLLDDTVITASGAVSATLSLRGLLQVADPLAAASSTVTGVSGAYLALTAAISTSTCQVATSSVLTLQTNGKVKQSCLDLSLPFNWSALHVFSAGLIAQASSTIFTSLTIPTSNSATSSLSVGCMTYYATSTQTPLKLKIASYATTTSTFGSNTNGFPLVAVYGACP